VRRKAIECKPKLIIAGASTYPRDLDYKKFRSIADEVGALLLCDIAHGIGLAASGVNNDPFPYADFVTASTSKTLRGPRAGLIYFKGSYKTKIDQSVFPGVLGAP
jgi:glycine hydroxymethyltransferase